MFIIGNLKTNYYRRRLLVEDGARLEYISRGYLCSFLKFLKSKVPFYRELLRGSRITRKNAVEILKQLPVSTKNDIREDHSRRAEFVGKDWPDWRNTGGSTGEPLSFPGAGLPRWAPNREQLCQAWLYKRMTGKFEPKILSVDGTRINEEDPERNIYWKESSDNFPYGAVHLSTLYLNKETISYYARKIDEVCPEVIRGYPSGVAELARLSAEIGYKFRCRIKGVYLTSENIHDSQVKIITETFGCPVWGQYGHSECSIFGVRVPGKESYECHPISGFTEVLREDGSHVEPGETGEVVVTGFTNRAQPFVRYRTGDIAEYGGIRNGFTILNRLVGRSTDFIIDRDRKKHYLVGLVFGGHISAFNHIDGWQIEQTAPGELRLYIVKGKTYTNETERVLVDFFARHGFDAITEYVESLRKNANGKQPFLIKNPQSSLG